MAVETLRQPFEQTRDEGLLAESALIQRAKTGDPEAWTNIFNKNFPRVYNYCLGKIGSQQNAEDLTSQVFVRAIESIPTYEERGIPFSAWLFKIAHNIIVSEFRRKTLKGSRVSRTVPLSEIEDGGLNDFRQTSPEDSVIAKITFEEILERIKKLPKTQSDVIELRFAAGFSVAKTAQALNKTESNIKAIQRKALIKLRQA